MKKSIAFRLNNKPVDIEVSGNELLLPVLRSLPDTTGTKYGCGIGQCGACTVIVDKEAVRSCMLMVEDVEGKDVITIEGLEAQGKLHPVQQSFIEHEAFQCGYCTPGMIMNAYGLLLKNKNPSKAEIISGMEENLCRCGSYNRIVDAIQSAAKEMYNLKH